ncbi:cation transporter [Arcanobacterium hippocoleae]
MSIRLVLWLVAAINALFFITEMCAAIFAGSVSLFADSVDFFEDGAIAALVMLALGWTARRRKTVAIILSGIILLPAAAAIVTAIQKLIAPSLPSGTAITVTAIAALAVNLLCAAMLAAYRRGSGTLLRAAWLAARNDAIASILIIATGLVTAATATFYFDAAVGVIVALINLRAAKEVWEAAHGEMEDEYVDLLSE